MTPKRYILLVSFLLATGGSMLGTSLTQSALASRSSTGSYTLPAGNPVVSGTAISSTVHNATMADIATEITNSLDRTGRGDMTGALQLYAGSVSAPGLTFSGNTASGLYKAASNDLRMAINGAQVSKWTSTGLAVTGKLTTTATNSTFVGNVAVDSAGSNTGTTANVLLIGSPTSGEAIGSKRSAGGNQFGLDFYTGGAQSMSITNTGGVRIPGSTATHPGTAITASYGASYTIDFGSTGPAACASSAQTLTGVTAGGVCMVSSDSHGCSANGATYSCDVTGADTVTIYYCTPSSCNPASDTYRVRVFQP
jgi:hypothetical protein